LGVDFQHDRLELLENIAAELRTTGRFDSSDPNQVTYSTLFLSGNKHIKWDWKIELYKDPILLTDSFHWAQRAEVIRGLVRDLTLLENGLEGLSPDIKQVITHAFELAKKNERKSILDDTYITSPKDLAVLQPIREFFNKHNLTHPEIYIFNVYRKSFREAGSGKIASRQRMRQLCQVYADEHCGFLIYDGTDVCELALPEYADAMVDLIEQVNKEWLKLSQDQKNAVAVLCSKHGSVLLALLLVNGECSPSAYAASVFSGILDEKPSSSLLRTLERTDLANVDYEHIQYMKRHMEKTSGSHDNYNQASYKDILAVANIVIDYLRLCENPIMSLIRGGENMDVEFKESFRWDTREGRNNKEVTKAAWKSIVAFLNSRGGTLLLGVSDDNVPVGIEHDGYKNQDTYHRALVETISSRIGSRFAHAVQIIFSQTGPHQVISIECTPPVPREHAYLDGKDLYVRQGPMSKHLINKELERWISNNSA